MASSDVEKRTRSFIQSLLTSTPLKCSIRQLGLDYKHLIGEEIPYQQMGYKSVEHFLLSIPDIVTVTGRGPHAEVEPVISEKSAHINELVTKQNVNRKPKGKGRFVPPRRSSGLSHNYHRFNNVNAATKPKIVYPTIPSLFDAQNFGFQPNTTISSTGEFSSTSSSTTRSEVNLPVAPRPLVNFTIKRSNPALRINVSKEFDETSRNKAVKESSDGAPAVSNSALRNNAVGSPLRHNTAKTFEVPPRFLNSALQNNATKEFVNSPNNAAKGFESSPRFSNSVLQNNDSKEFIGSPKVSNFALRKNSAKELDRTRTGLSHATHPQKHQDNKNESAKKNVSKNALLNLISNNNYDEKSKVPKLIQSNLIRLIGRFEDGIWCVDLPTEYMKLYGSRLNYANYGFRNLIDMCSDLPHIFHYVRPGVEDFKLYDRSKPLPDAAGKRFTLASFNEKPTKELSDGNEGRLPQCTWSEWLEFLPPDITRLGTEIEHQFVPSNLKESDLIDIVVGEIYDPSKFWIYLAESPLDLLMNEMQSFYKEKSEQYRIPPDLIKDGLYCVQIIFGEYHRALIVDTMPGFEGQVRVVYIDYGTMTKVRIDGMCFLASKFAQLPAQAIRCRLANIYPAVEGCPWPQEATQRFQRLVAKRDITAKINHVDVNNQYLEVYLADTTEEQIFYINDVLVEENLAQYCNKKQRKCFSDPNYKTIVKNIHLFPTFYELEYGLAPSTGEMLTLLSMDVPINFCYPQYFATEESSDSQEQAIIRSVELNHNINVDLSKTFVEHTYNLDDIKNEPFDFSLFGEITSEIEEIMLRKSGDIVNDDDIEFVDAPEDESSTSSPTLNRNHILCDLEFNFERHSTNPFLNSDLSPVEKSYGTNPFLYSDESFGDIQQTSDNDEKSDQSTVDCWENLLEQDSKKSQDDWIKSALKKEAEGVLEFKPPTSCVDETQTTAVKWSTNDGILENIKCEQDVLDYFEDEFKSLSITNNESASMSLVSVNESPTPTPPIEEFVPRPHIIHPPPGFNVQQYHHPQWHNPYYWNPPPFYGMPRFYQPQQFFNCVNPNAARFFQQGNNFNSNPM